MPDYNMRERREQIADKYMGGGSEEEEEASMSEEPGEVADSDLQAEMIDENTVKLTHPDGRVLEITKEGPYAQYFEMAMSLAKGMEAAEGEKPEAPKEEPEAKPEEE
jgi:hypothetical protein